MNARYTLIDWLRAFAIVLMVAYHFMWDLVEVGLMGRDTFNSFPIRTLGRACLITFLFCVGYSLSLSHADKINWHSFFKRWLKLAIISLAISLLTYLSYPSKWVYFGIIHHICVTSIFLLAFLKFRLVGLALGVYILLPYWFDALGGCSLLPKTIYFWLDNCRYPKLFLHSSTMDYIGLTPWVGASLIGMGASYFDLHKKIILPRVGFIEYISRYSLEVYLIHQPILLGLAFLLAYML